MKVSTINKALVVEYILGAILAFLGVAIRPNPIGAILFLEGFVIIITISILFAFTLSTDYGELKFINGKWQRVE